MTDEQLLAAVERYMTSGAYSGREDVLASATLRWAKKRGANVDQRYCKCGKYPVDGTSSVLDGIEHSMKRCK